MRKRNLREDPSGYTTSATRPDPLDPNDRKRQQTQARAGDYPYDMPTSYGQPQGVDSGGAAYQLPPTTRPPNPEKQGAKSWQPKDPWNLANEALGRLGNYEPGSQADDAAALGYGNHDLMGDGLSPEELDMDALRHEFRTSFEESLPVAREMGRHDLFTLLVDLDPEYSADLFAPDDDSEMLHLYTDWGRRLGIPDDQEDGL